MNTLRSAFCAIALCAIAALAISPAHAATYTLNQTTTSAAVATTDRSICLTSATGVNVPTISVPGSNIFVDTETMYVISAVPNSTTCFNVGRVGGGSHLSGAVVYIGAPNLFTSYDRSGSCTATTEYVLPVINTSNGRIFDCRSSGQWFQLSLGTMRSASTETIRAWCTGTAGSAETEYLTGAACSGATTSTTRYVVGTPGTLANLKVSLSAAGAGGTNKDVITVLKNGTTTGITVTTGTTACATAVVAACIDTTHSASVVAGDVITFSFVSATSDTAANVSAVLEKY